MKILGKTKIRTLTTPPSDLPLTHDEFIDWLWKNWPYDKDEAYVGLSKVWGMPAYDPFNYCAWEHDGYYTFKHVHNRSKKFGDEQFNLCMKKIVAKGKASNLRRIIYKMLVRSPVGIFAWVT